MLVLGQDDLRTDADFHEKEWLVTNGIGGLATGTISGVMSRRYHGLLIAALAPPLGRTMLVSRLDETVTSQGQIFPLYSHHLARVAQPTINGHRHLSQFALDGTIPTWTYAIDDARLEKRLWMLHGENTTIVRYDFTTGTAPLDLALDVLVNDTDFHLNVEADAFMFSVSEAKHGLRIKSDHGQPFYVLCPDADHVETHHEWVAGFYQAIENYRGQDDVAAHCHVATFTKKLMVGESLTLIFTTVSTTAQHAAELTASAVLSQAQLREQILLEWWRKRHPSAPGWLEQLVLAADQFIVERASTSNPNGRTVLAGYHWFSDWGRDTMIALAGLTLSTGRFEDAAIILRTFAQFIDRGMLPNRFPDHGDTPEYNTVDATLWYFEAIKRYVDVTGDTTLLHELFPILRDIIEWHEKGTRYSIHVDPTDGLLYSGETGVQLTWMDVKVGDWVVTPRTGKAVEINALWFNALRSMAIFAEILGYDGDAYRIQAEQVEASYQRFWNTETGYCFDVIDGPQGNDSTLRPNQLFAVALSHPLLTSDQQRQILDVCVEHLVTPRGLRSLAPFEKAYIGHYGGDILARDGAYHQGTVWGWLMGAFVNAHLTVYADAEVAYQFLAPFEGHLKEHGVGSIAEIFDGDAPHAARGCIAQAWSVAEVLRAYEAIEQKRDAGLSVNAEN